MNIKKILSCLLGIALILASSNFDANVANAEVAEQMIFHHTDQLSGTSIDTDESGSIVEAVDYYPFGEIRIDQKTGSYENKHKFTGKEFDESAALYYYGARYYDPTIGRFISADPLDGDLANPQSLNKYSYVVNNPLKYVDPTGEAFLERMWGFVNGICDSAINTVNALIHPVATVTSVIKYFANNTKYLYNYAQNSTLSQFASDVRVGVQIRIDEFNQMSEYDKGHAIGTITENGWEVAVLGRSIEWGFGKTSGVVDNTISSPFRDTLERIKTGEKYPHRNDGAVFRNNIRPNGKRLLPKRPTGYYTEYVHPTPGGKGPGAQRIITGQKGEIYYSPDHYDLVIDLH